MSADEITTWSNGLVTPVGNFYKPFFSLSPILWQNVLESESIQCLNFVGKA
jgi:hypothetical protein